MNSYQFLLGVSPFNWRDEYDMVLIDQLVHSGAIHFDVIGTANDLLTGTSLKQTDTITKAIESGKNFLAKEFSSNYQLYQHS